MLFSIIIHEAVKVFYATLDAAANPGATTGILSASDRFQKRVRMKPRISAAPRIPVHLLPANSKGRRPVWDAVAAVSTAVSAGISLFVLIVGLFALKYTANQIEDFRKEAQAQHLIEKAQEFDSPRFKAIRRALAKKRLDQSEDTLKKLNIDDVPGEMFDELNLCNDLGVLTRHGALSAYDVWADFSYWLLPLHADAQPLIKHDQLDAPASWKNCDYLVEEVKKVDAQEDAGKQLNQKEEDIIGFYQGEIE